MYWVDETPLAFQEKIVGLARQLVARRPADPQSWLSLADALRARGLIHDTLACLADAIPRFPDNAQLRFSQALAFEELADVGGALQALDEALALAPRHRGAHAMRCKLMLKSAPKGRGMALLDGFAAALGDGRELARLRQRALFRDGRLAELAAQCDRDLTRFPGDTIMIYFKAVALAKLGRPAEACAVLSLDRFVDVAMLPVPAGFADAAGFCAQLGDEIARNRNFIRDPKGKSTREGLQSRHLVAPDAPAVTALLGQIKAHVDAYADGLGRDTHGFAKVRPDKVRLSAWAVLSEAEGHQVSHHHPSGWLSGVFYVDAPRAPDGAFRGSLLLGALDDESGEPPWGTLTVEPRPGRIVLFPSYVPHATVAPGIGGRRIVVAFDVVPAQPTEDSGAAESVV